MRLENGKIYLDGLCIGVVGEDREVIRVLKKAYLKDIFDLAISDEKLKDFRWETYSPEE